MNIGIFTDLFLPHLGGTETSIFNQSRALRAAGHNVYIITGKMSGRGHVNDDDDHVVRLTSKPFSLSFDGAEKYIYNKNAYHILDKLKLDIVHVQTEYSYGMLGVRYARARNIRVIYTPHTFLSAQIELLYKFPLSLAIIANLVQKLYLRPYHKAPKPKYLVDCEGIPTKTLAQKIILKCWVNFAAQADVIVAPSLRMKNFLQAQAGFEDVKILANPYPVSTGINIRKPVRPIKFVFVGRLSDDKRPDVVVDAFTKIPVDMGELNVYGGGPLQKTLENTAQTHKNINIHGFVAQDSVDELLMQHDVFILSSQGFDNQPMVILEALNAGLAIIYCDSYLKDGLTQANSIIFSGDSNDLSVIVDKLARDVRKLANMKTASRQLATKYSYENFAKSYEKILLQLSKS